MRLFEFKPTDIETLDHSKEQIVDLIEKNCSDYLKIMKSTNHYLGRNVPMSSGFAFLGSSPIDRKPKDTLMRWANRIDRRLSKAGFTALRSNSIFCFPKKIGKFISIRYAIFPFNGFSYSYCDNVGDLTNYFDLSTMNNDESPTEYGIRSSNFKRSLFDKSITDQQFVNTYNFKQTDLKQALTQDNEILIHGKYIALAVSQGVPLLNFSAQQLDLIF